MTDNNLMPEHVYLSLWKLSEDTALLSIQDESKEGVTKYTRADLAAPTDAEKSPLTPFDEAVEHLEALIRNHKRTLRLKHLESEKGNDWVVAHTTFADREMQMLEHLIRAATAKPSREVVETLKQKRNNADFHCCNCPVASMAEAYHQGERAAYEEALALLEGGE